MAGCEDDVIFSALERQGKAIDSVLLSKCNMNQKMREDARLALKELKASVYQNISFIKIQKFVKACKGSLKEAVSSLAKK